MHIKNNIVSTYPRCDVNVTQCANSFRLFPFPAVLVEYCEVQLYESV